MNDDYKKGYADAMGWKTENHLEHLPPKEQAPMNYYRADAEGNLERTDIHFAQPEPVACDCDSPAWCKQYKRCNRTMLGFMPYVAQRKWIGLTDEEIDKGLVRTNYAMQTAGAWRDGVEWAIKQLKEKNSA